MGLVQVTRTGTKVAGFLPNLLAELAPEFGAKVFAEPDHGYVGYVEFPSGRRCFFTGASLDANPHGASVLTKDKDYCARMLAHLGYTVPQGIVLFSPAFKREISLRKEALAAGLSFAERALGFAHLHGFPLFVKPVDGLEGRGVTKVYSVDELFEALWWLFAEDKKVLLQVPLSGRDFRVVVMDGKVVAAYERRPLAVTGDGHSPISALVDIALARLRNDRHGSKVSHDDHRILTQLKANGMTMETVLDTGREVPLLPNANLSTGGTARDVTGDISAFYSKIAIGAAKDLGLLLVGIDIIAKDITGFDTDYCILEVNSAPGLNNFATSSAASQERARELYRQLLAKLSRQ